MKTSTELRARQRRFERLYFQPRLHMYNYAYQSLRNSHEAEDVTQAEWPQHARELVRPLLTRCESDARPYERTLSISHPEEIR